MFLDPVFVSFGCLAWKILSPGLIGNQKRIERAEANEGNEEFIQMCRSFRALKEADGNRTKAAVKIGMSRRTLHHKLHEYHL